MQTVLSAAKHATGAKGGIKFNVGYVFVVVVSAVKQATGTKPKRGKIFNQCQAWKSMQPVPGAEKHAKWAGNILVTGA